MCSYNMDVHNVGRNLKEVNETLILAKLKHDDLVGPPQILSFGEDASDHNVTLIQLNKDVLDVIEKGESLVIRGQDDDSAVLCTENQTYTIKKAITSNTLLLLPNCKSSVKELELQQEGDENIILRNIVGWKHDYLELKRCKPLVSRIKKLLEESPYMGPEKERENVGKNKYTLSHLLNTVQASEEEIMQCLFKIGSCCLDGFWRVLDFGYVVDCLGELLNVIDSESWDWKCVSLNELCEKVNDSGELVPVVIVQHLMSNYGSVARNVDSNDGLIYELNEEKMCRFFAEMLLRDVGKFNLKEFLEVWEQSVPPGMVPQKDHLRGLAMIDDSSKPETVQLFSVASLPQDPSERFDLIFDMKPKWTLVDITPYVEDLCLEGQKVSALLTKYTRSSLQNTVKLFSSRKIRLDT